MLVLPEDYTSQVTNHSRVQRLSTGQAGAKPSRGPSREGRPQGSGLPQLRGGHPTSSSTPSTPPKRASSGMGETSASSSAPRSVSARIPHVSTPIAARTTPTSTTTAREGSLLPSDSFRRTAPASPTPSSQHASPAPQPYELQRSGSGGADDESASEMSSETEMLPQGVDVLAALASLGVNQQLRSRVQEALDTLEAAAAASSGEAPAASSRHHTHTHPAAQGRWAGGAGTTSTGPARAIETAFRKKMEALEAKLTMSRSIMRKLYHKTVELEKELQVAQANSGGAILHTHSTASLLAAAGEAGNSGRLMTAMAGSGVSPVALALQERDHTIAQLQHALEASRRRCALLEGQQGVPASGGRGGAGGKGRPGAAAGKDTGLREVLAQSQLHFTKYKQIREDYNRLLYKRAGTIQTSKAASSAAKVVVDEMQSRLVREIAEREAEAALYSARLYESERQMSDWYVERRLLEDHIAQLREEAASRDKLDAEIESCVCGLFERLKLLEGTNEQLRLQLVAAGIEVDTGVGPGAMSGVGGEADRLVCD